LQDLRIQSNDSKETEGEHHVNGDDGMKNIRGSLLREELLNPVSSW